MVQGLNPAHYLQTGLIWYYTQSDMTFYFYDVETSGFNPRHNRIMQFGGQRTGMDLEPIGQPDNFLIKMTPDVLPEPDAVLTHGITPQQTLADGLSEAEFLKHFSAKIASPNTIMVGFNNIRFDDEFMRFTLWRNFYDAYEWQWKNGSSKWDLLDVVRMTRALRPDGIEWPFAPDGKASNRLEFLSSVNKIGHDSAHDALSDVKAEMAIAQLIKSKQPKLFEYLLSLRSKTNVEVLVNKREPFIYTSGRYSSEFHKTTIATKLAADADNRGSFVYDLRTDPKAYLKMSPKQLADKWKYRPRKEKEPDEEQFPVKLLAYNRNPAIAPLSVLDGASKARLKIDMNDINKNLKALRAAKGFDKAILEARELLYPAAQPKLLIDEQQVDGQLYDGFVSEQDRIKARMVRAADSGELSSLNPDFADERLQLLFPLYKARNFPKSLSKSEQTWWEEFKVRRLLDGGETSKAAAYFKRLEELRNQKSTNDQQKHLLEELDLYGQSVIPAA